MKDDTSKQCNVSLQAFYDHFKEIYSQNSDFKIDQVDAFIENNFSQNNENGVNSESNIFRLAAHQCGSDESIFKIKEKQESRVGLIATRVIH